MAILHVPAAQRAFRDHGWLRTHWLFSFGDWFDPAHESFGRLRVYNDDQVAVEGGFPTHGHRDMEIVTLVWSGAIAHADSTGGQGVLGPGEVQAMSAGRGIRHSEFQSGAAACHLHQLWLLPRQPGIAPSYRQAAFPVAERAGGFQVVASGWDEPGALPIASDASVAVAEPAAGGRLAIPAAAGRWRFLYLAHGAATVAGVALAAGDQLRVADGRALAIAAGAGSRVVLVETAPG
jgi:redox-sensitive bicupin YhaK (pirin superfamily)